MVFVAQVAQPASSTTSQTPAYVRRAHPGTSPEAAKKRAAAAQQVTSLHPMAAALALLAPLGRIAADARLYQSERSPLATAPLPGPTDPNSRLWLARSRPTLAFGAASLLPAATVLLVSTQRPLKTPASTATREHTRRRQGSPPASPAWSAST